MAKSTDAPVTPEQVTRVTEARNRLLAAVAVARESLDALDRASMPVGKQVALDPARAAYQRVVEAQLALVDVLDAIRTEAEETHGADLSAFRDTFNAVRADAKKMLDGMSGRLALAEAALARVTRPSGKA